MGLFSTPPAARYGPGLLDRLPLGISIYKLEPDGGAHSFRIVYSNPASGELTGLDPTAEVGRLLREVAPGFEAAGFPALFCEVLREGAPRDIGPVEYGDARVAEGTYSIHAIPLAADVLAVVFEDVAERAEVRELHRAQAELEREAARSRTLLDAVGDVVLVYPIGPGGPEPFLSFNAAAVARYGYSADELRAMTVDDLIDGTRFDTTTALEELRRSRAATFESVHLTRSGDRIYMSTHARLVEVDGRLCVVSLCRDDADRRQFRREIARSNRELEAAVADRTRLLEAFSEDLKILHAITTAEHATPQARFDAYLEAGCRMFDLPIGILSSTPIDEETGSRLYRLEAVVSPDSALEPGLTVPITDAFCDSVVETGRTVTYADATEDAPDHPACVGRGLRAFIGTPVVVDGELFGTLNFVSPAARAGGFSDVERDLVEVMAQAVGRRISADRAEAAELASRERYRTIVETVDAGVIVVDRGLAIVMSNPSARELLGLDVDHGHRDTDDFLGRWPVVGADGRRLTRADLPEHRAIETGAPVRGAIQGIAPPGESVRWYRVNATPLDDDRDGTTDAVVVSFHDVTDLKDAALAAERSQGMLEAVLAAADTGVMAFRTVRDGAGATADFEWILVTPLAGEIVGRAPDALVGRRLLDVFPGNREAGLFEAYARVVRTGEPFETFVPYEHDGLSTSFQLRAVPMGAEDGFVVTFSEVAEAQAVSFDLGAEDS